MTDRPGPPDVLPWTTWSVDDLLAAKGSTRVAVVIPARDEEATVGAVVEAVRRAFVDEVPLVDELVVIDSDSADGTAEVAAAAGAAVHAAREIRPDLGVAQGKGEALWKSLHVTTGDLVVFLDSDLLEWGPHFVPGLVGPLLTQPDVMLVKAVYDRPLLDEHGQEAERGGRVTELVARPLLALHRPELSGLVQPLAGEWSVRRTAFEGLSVPVGYGVEIAAVIDITDQYGAGAVAQVDLGRRTHRHHQHDTLGPMAVQQMAAVQARANREPAGRVPGARAHDSRRGAIVKLTQFDSTPTGFVPTTRHVDVIERPPARDVPGYLDALTARRACLVATGAGQGAASHEVGVASGRSAPVGGWPSLDEPSDGGGPGQGGLP